MKLIFVSGPYTADSPLDIQRNILEAERWSVKLMRQGYAVHAPHKNTARYETYGLDSLCYENALEVLKRCDTIAMIPGWKGSKGATRQHEKALKWGKEMIYLGEASSNVKQHA